MVDATDSQPGTYPDRASFATALYTARNQIAYAVKVIADVVRTVGRAVLGPPPTRPPRPQEPRMIKR